MRSQSCTIELPLLKDHSYLALLQEEHGPPQMAVPATCLQNGEATHGTGLDGNHCDLYKEILDDFCELETSCEQYEVEIEGILKYLQDPRPLNTIALEQYFDEGMLLETQELTVRSAPLSNAACYSSYSTDNETVCQTPIAPSCIKAKSRKRAADGDNPRGQEITSQDSALSMDATRPKHSRGGTKTKGDGESKTTNSSSPSAIAKEEQLTQNKRDEENLPASPEHSPKTPGSFSPVTYPSGINHLKQLKNQVSRICVPICTQNGSNTSITSVNRENSIANGLDVSSGGFHFFPSYTLPQQVVNIPVNGPIQPGTPTCFLVVNKSLAALEITTLLPTSSVHSPPGAAQGFTSQNVSAIPRNASPVSSNADSPVSSVNSPVTPGFSSPQSIDIQSSPESMTNGQPVDIPTTPASVGSEGPYAEIESSGEESSEPMTPTIKLCTKTKGVEAGIETVKEYLKDMSQHSYICHEHDEMLLEDIYVDVTMVEGQAENKSGRNATKCLDKECRIYDIAERERAAVNMSNLFDISGKRQKETKVVALLGRAGIGKSVLVQRICHDWVNGCFGQFEFVFWFKCRTLNFAKQYTFRDLLFQPFLPSLKNTDEVFQYLCHNSHKVLVIFDDFEDFQDHDGLMQPITCSSTEKPRTVKQLLAGLLQKKLLKGCTVLITARPKETFNQYLGRVDKIVEVLGFSPGHIQEFLQRYFEDSSIATEAMAYLQEQQYMLSFCYVPLLCRFICFVLKAMHRTGDSHLALPSTLTNLFLNIFQILLHREPSSYSQTQNVIALQKHKQNILELSKRAFTGVQRHECVCTDSRSAEMSNFALQHGLLRPFLMTGEGEEQECGKTFSHSSLQNFLGALFLLFSENIKCKGLRKIILLEQRKRKSQEDWLDIVRRFLAGLAFQEGNAFINCFSNHSKANIKSKKQKSLQKYLTELEVSTLSTSKLLELCHCVYETQNTELATRVATKLSEKLSFSGMRLTPPDVFVLLYVMQKSPNNFAVDLRDTSIDLQGIKQFIELKNVTLFRVSVSDAVKLWEHLEQTGLRELLHQSLVKFSVNPFEVKNLKNIDELDLLVQIHKDRRFLSCTQNTSGGELCELPAIRTLQMLEFALGPVNGLQGFRKLTKILPALAFLKYLDLEGPSSQQVKMSENKIGDEGAERLAEVLPNLTSLEELTLSRNQIADRGAQKLARSLPNLKSLRTLSLYDNIIGDKGAEKLAEILPVMKSLKVLDVQFNKITDVGAQTLTQSLKNCPHIERIWMWSPTITHWMSEHLQQIDVRINLQ
ncbi:MHC class II transactivator [Heptranchias perlo]|uniref:MHC class II transactivator n=1 Tax=Heptranchias perlo TaxID=212740 RepID=UPI003559FE98